MRQAMSLSSRRDLIRAPYERYQKSKSRARKEVLDEFVAATSYHRTNALEVLSHPPPSPWPRNFWSGTRAAPLSVGIDWSQGSGLWPPRNGGG